MARLKADDPLIPVTFRLPASAVAKLTADKAWREKLRTLVLASLSKPPTVHVEVQIGPRRVAYGALAKGRKP